MNKTTVGLFALTLMLQGLLSLAQFDDVTFDEDNGKQLPLPDKPATHKWFYNNGNVTCVMISVGARFTFNYTSADGEKQTDIDLLNDYPAPYNTTSSTGTCGADKNTLSVSFLDNSFTLEVELKTHTENSSYYLSKLSLKYYLEEGKMPIPDIVGNVSGTAETADLQELFTAVGRSYECESKLFFSPKTSEPHLDLITFEKLQIQAFRTENTTNFNEASSCPQDAVSNIVPIAVGAALGALVIIVLIAYLIGRRKATRGYESV